MAAVLRNGINRLGSSRAGQFLKEWWDKEPIIVLSYASGILGVTMMGLSPLTYRMEKEMQAWPSAYSMYELPEEEPKYFEDMSGIPKDQLPAWKVDQD